MATILFAYSLFLVFSCQIQGSRAMTPVFVKKGEDVVLKLMRDDLPKEFSFLSWQFNGSNTLVTFTPGKVQRISAVYKGRVEPSVTTYSVTLKNLQHADSGVYTAQVTADKEQELAQYDVTVQDPVSPVNLTVNSVSSSSDSCNFTLTCNTQDSHHINSTFSCDTKACSQDGGERSKATTSGASLRVYLSEDLIICNHSNHVSWTQDNKTIELFCPRHTDKSESKDTHNIVIVIVVILIIGCVAVAVGLFIRHFRKRKDHRENIENTVYATCEIQSKPQPQHPTTNDASSPNTIYSEVGQHTGS